MKERIVEKREFQKKLRSLVYPIAFQEFMLATVSACDAVMLGKVSQDSLSAVSLAAQVQFVLSLFLGATTMGTSIFAAQYWGKGDKQAIERLFGMVMKVSVAVSGLFSLAALVFPSGLMRIFTNDVVLIELGSEYLRTVSLSYLLCGISQLYLCILKNSGLAGRASLISSAAVVVNIVFNWGLIYGVLGLPALGIKGAAFATVLARVLEVIWSIAESLKKDRIHLRKAYLVHTDAAQRRDFI